ncbi:MAG: NAD(P)H-hydrate dehydratase [Thermoplasmata archaeon]|nr:MAG: NAD(P)H-hydrate dehydratase [Thermoplasmata archaeon]
MIPFKEVNVLDINAEYLGVPTSQLMENAGKATAQVALEGFGIAGRKVSIICGPGNNGGDGFVAARHLREECQIDVILVRPRDNIRSDIARANFHKIEDKMEIVDASELDTKIQGAHLIIDAMLGIGIAGEMREPYLSCIETINRADIPVLSVDVPSGLGTRYPVVPDMTVTFHDVKEGMDKKNSGEIRVVDIGIPKEAEQYLGPGEFVYYPRPEKDSHKGDNGRLLIIGGGPYSGAPALAGLAAYRIGVDLVHIATPAKTFEIIASFSPNFIVHRLGGDVLTKDDIKSINSIMKKIDAVIIGPGLGEAKVTAEAVKAVITNCQKPLVIDADAVKPTAEDISILKGKKGVLTPHAREFNILSSEAVKTDIEERSEQVRAFAEKTEFTVLLKGSLDIVSDGEHIKLNITGHPAMTVGGTGDVLAGLVGGMLAKGASPFNSARIAAFTNGLAGELAFEGLGHSMMASDIIERIPPVLKSFLR